MVSTLKYADKSVCAKKLGRARENRTLGAEIEVLPALGWLQDEFAERLSACAPHQFHAGEFVIKEDGSLDGVDGFYDDFGDYQVLNGLEIVTGVMAQEYAQAYDWDTFFLELSKVVYPVEFSPDGDSPDVGLHIHADVLWGCPERYSQVERQEYGEQLRLALGCVVDGIGCSSGKLDGDLRWLELVRLFGRVSEYAKSLNPVSLYHQAPKWRRELRYWVSRLRTSCWDARERWKNPSGMYQVPFRELSGKDIRCPNRVDREGRFRGDRYSLVNLTGNDTVEFRGFLTPRNASQLRYALELVTALMDYVSDWVMSGSTKAPSWTAFLCRAPEFSNRAYAAN
ncbi:hypothetical protein ACJU26_08880 [Acidithiobacillus sp. M4-SHS-6]|uniref:hypothetical protein n=1 Tax=Acidithiobacillus sp. M4-SHS-6 TaxID=3383024 RepID=UPI0039BE5DC6